MSKNLIEPVIQKLSEGENYYLDFTTFDLHKKLAEDNKFNAFKDAYGILNDKDKMDKLITTYIIQDNPKDYYYDKAQDTLHKEKNPSKANFIIDHLLKLSNDNQSLFCYYIFKTECYLELKQYYKVLYCTDQVLKFAYQEHIEKSSRLDINQLTSVCLEPRVLARINLHQLKEALKDCDTFLELVAIVTQKPEAMPASNVYNMKAKVYEAMNDEQGRLAASEKAEEIFYNCFEGFE